MVKTENIKFQIVNTRRTIDSEMLVGELRITCEGSYNAYSSDKSREFDFLKQKLTRSIGFILFDEVIAKLIRIERTAELMAPGDWEAQENLVAMVSELRKSLEW